MYLNLEILKAIREADSRIVVNGRLARVGNINFGDYANTGDRAAFFPQQRVFGKPYPPPMSLMVIISLIAAIKAHHILFGCLPARLQRVETY